MNQNDFVTEYIINSAEIKQAFNKLTSGSNQYKDDLWQEILLYYLQMPIEKINELVKQGAGRIKGHFIITVKNQLHSKTSTFYYKYRYKNEQKNIQLDEQMLGLTNEEDQMKENDDFAERVSAIYNKLLDDLHWYDAELFNLYMEHQNEVGTLKRISDVTGIPYGAVQSNIAQTRKYLQYRINAELTKQERKTKKWKLN